jgi:hypothetical protein
MELSFWLLLMVHIAAGYPESRGQEDLGKIINESHFDRLSRHLD